MLNPWLARRKSQSLRELDRIEIDAAASELVMEYGELILSDAIRFSINRPDAEDAYQRSLEILLTKAPTTDREQLVPWLRVVVRNEATNIARSRHNRNLRLDETSLHSSAALEDIPDDRVEDKLQLERHAEALRRLSKDQLLCLVAQSEGLTYDEISDRTGFTRRKVTRCLQDGRRNFSRHIDAIAKGSECERMQPLIAKLFESDTEAAIELGPHLRHCIACREQVRSYRSAPNRVAALFPPVIVIAGAQSRAASTPISKLLDQIVHVFNRWTRAHVVEKVAAAGTLTAIAVGGGLLLTTDGPKGPGSDRGAASEVSAGEIPVVPLGRIVQEVEVTSRRDSRKPKNRSHRESGLRGSGSGSGEASTAPQSSAQPQQPVRTDPGTAADAAEPVDDGSTEFLPEAR